MRWLVDDFLSFDYIVETSETPIELDILDRMKNEKNTPMDCAEDEDDEHWNDVYGETNKTLHVDILKSFETTQRGLEF